MSWNTVVASIPGMNRQRLAIIQFTSMRCNITTVLSQTNLNKQRTNLQLSNKVLLAFWASLICYPQNNHFLKIVFIPVSHHVNFKDFKDTLPYLLNGENFQLLRFTLTNQSWLLLLPCNQAVTNLRVQTAVIWAHHLSCNCLPIYSSFIPPPPPIRVFIGRCQSACLHSGRNKI